MKRALLVAVVLLAPTALAWHNVVLVRARMDTVFDPLALGPVWDFTFTLRNDGPPQRAWAAIHEAPIVFDLMWTQWVGEPWMETGETKEITVRIDWTPPEAIAVPGPDWFCLEVVELRCWSVLVGVPTPDGVYPEDVPHWLLQGVPHGRHALNRAVAPPA